jgi:hypothetical protein
VELARHPTAPWPIFRHRSDAAAPNGSCPKFVIRAHPQLTTSSATDGAAPAAGAAGLVHTEKENREKEEWGKRACREEAKCLLLYALSAARGAEVGQGCSRCGRTSSRLLQYDTCWDPLGSGSAPPAPGYVDTGADILLYRGALLAASLAFTEQPLHGASPDSWVALDPHAAALASLRFILAALVTPSKPSGQPELTSLETQSHRQTGTSLAAGQGCDRKLNAPQKEESAKVTAYVVLGDTRWSAGCGGSGCVPLREVATQLGWRRMWTSDDIDWSASPPDVSQWVANSCTGKIRVFYEWRQKPEPPQPLDGKQLATLEEQIVRRARCLMCEKDGGEAFSVRSPFCAGCGLKVQRQSYRAMPYESAEMNRDDKERRTRSLFWIRYPYVRKPDTSHDDPELPVPEKPCSACATTRYRPLFYFGYRAICSPCLAADFSHHMPRTPPKPVP